MVPAIVRAAGICAAVVLAARYVVAWGLEGLGASDAGWAAAGVLTIVGVLAAAYVGAATLRRGHADSRAHQAFLAGWLGVLAGQLISVTVGGLLTVVVDAPGPDGPLGQLTTALAWTLLALLGTLPVMLRLRP